MFSESNRHGEVLKSMKSCFVASSLSSDWTVNLNYAIMLNNIDDKNGAVKQMSLFRKKYEPLPPHIKAAQDPEVCKGFVAFQVLPLIDLNQEFSNDGVWE